MGASPATEAQTISKLVCRHSGLLSLLRSAYSPLQPHRSPCSPLRRPRHPSHPSHPLSGLLGHLQSASSPRETSPNTPPRGTHTRSAVPVQHCADPTALSPQRLVILELLPPGQCCLVQLENGGLRRPGATGSAVCPLCLWQKSFQDREHVLSTSLTQTRPERRRSPAKLGAPRQLGAP